MSQGIFIQGTFIKENSFIFIKDTLSKNKFKRKI